MSTTSSFEGKTKRCEEICSVIRVGLTSTMWVAICYFAFDAFKAIALQSPDQIGALAKFADSLKLQHVVPWACTLVTTVAWRKERAGKKRAIKEKSRLQKEIEANDPGRTSSGLTETGDTPGE